MPLGVKQHGKVGSEVTEEEAYQTARAVALQMLASIKAHTGDLDSVLEIMGEFELKNKKAEGRRQDRLRWGQQR